MVTVVTTYVILILIMGVLYSKRTQLQADCKREYKNCNTNEQIRARK